MADQVFLRDTNLPVASGDSRQLDFVAWDRMLSRALYVETQLLSQGCIVMEPLTRSRLTSTEQVSRERWRIRRQLTQSWQDKTNTENYSPGLRNGGQVAS